MFVSSLCFNASYAKNEANRIRWHADPKDFSWRKQHENNSYTNGSSSIKVPILNHLLLFTNPMPFILKLIRINSCVLKKLNSKRIFNTSIQYPKY